MPRTKGKKKGDAPARAEDPKVLNPNRPGMPAPDSVVDVTRMVRGGKVYRIIKTNEYDEYDKPEAPARGRKR